MIVEMTLEEVRACKFKPEPHTVAFTEDIEWYGYSVGGRIVSVLGVSDKHGGKYISSCYTSPAYRGRGLQSLLVLFVCEKYPDHKKIAHCLSSSKSLFEKCGFTHYKTVFYKHGTQYFMRKEAEATDGAKL